MGDDPTPNDPLLERCIPTSVVIVVVVVVLIVVVVVVMIVVTYGFMY